MDNIILFLSFVLSLGLTYVVRLLALKKNIIDTPNERSSHTNPTPRGGGLAIVISFYLVVMVFFLQGRLEDSVFIGLMGLLSIAVIGFIDDHDHIPARYRLLVHFAAAAWACFWFGIIPWNHHDNLLIMIGLWGISLFYLVWLLNLYNFMDGIDGIASIEAMTVIGSAVLLLLFDSVQLVVEGAQVYSTGLPIELLMALIVILLGFLIWNWPPAKIFMGDVGSAFLGILIAGFSLITANNGSLDFLIWIILLAVFITDATYTLMVRLFRGDKIYEAHRSHTYQILSRRFGHKRVTLGVLVINLFWLLPLAWLGHHYSQLLMISIVLAYVPLVILAMRHGAGHKN
ncbi:MAG: glycosyltransferase family 4 protein [gamma proteobacterium symbiont of Bathyaustriella thionipta]|nr:glycosyltransferase family 4 protein [gamma proteobacterium symbiont of Bathyaustriella thionipta]MCU7949342.1 glycosyltransferase family 4 protein [gamma proteobacterium symbiont of Bathyaustriella thionipta]MCU7952656.1 glycosyltransferase family 4 protein [gamma proteobacterium symbiont of Bathyaustriella thionipta]MCU7955533.1 glycosyltransferase family 4 protein [gamma proteobacterium symbiont of Bathyaustriella thionipta]MCU7968585.1 glycosyltransferase family 4 protein [gamma proteoba